MRVKFENIFTTIPLEILYKILDFLPLNLITNSRTLSVGLHNRINTYLAKELQIKQLNCGQNHSLVLLDNGRVLLIKNGTNEPGSLSEILNIDPIEFISTGFSHSIMLSRMNEIWVMGDNTLHQLPVDSAITSIDNPQQASSIKTIKYIAAGKFTTSVANDDKQDTFGEPYLKPRLFKNGLQLLPEWVSVPEKFDVVDVSVGDAHALLLTADGKCYGFGSNENGLLGLKTDIQMVKDWHLLSDKQIRQIKATTLGSLILTTDNTLMATGMNVKQQLSVDSDDIISSFKTIATNVKTFDADTYHTLYLDLSNQLHTMGYTEVKQPASIKKPSGVNLLTMALKLTEKKPAQAIPSQLDKQICNLNSFFKSVSASSQQDSVEVPEKNNTASISVSL